MSKNTSPHRIKLSDYKAKKADEGAIIIEDDQGREYRIPPREIWSDELLAAVQDADDTDPIAASRALLGDEYEAFVAGGGSALMLSSIIAEEWQEQVPNS